MKRECNRCNKVFERKSKFGLLCNDCLYKARRLKANYKLKEIMEIINKYEELSVRDINIDLREKIYKIFSKENK
jgi:hypothetical protein